MPVRRRFAQTRRHRPCRVRYVMMVIYLVNDDIVDDVAGGVFVVVVTVAVVVDSVGDRVWRINCTCHR